MDTPRPVTETMKEIKILSDKNKEYLFLQLNLLMKSQITHTKTLIPLNNYLS